MKKNLSILFLAFLLSLVAAACGTNNNATSGTETASAEEKTTGNTETMTIEHQLGKTDITKSPKNVIVFDFGILDSLDKLGVNVLGVPQANIPPYLSKYEDVKYENVGSLKEPDFEKIHSLEPELIIISGRQAEAYEELSKIAPTIFMGVDTTDYLPSYKENMTLLGEIFSKESEVAEELSQVEESIKALKTIANASGKNALIILANEGNISAYGPGSRFGIIHDEFGLTPVDNGIEVSTHGQNVSFEYILEKNPDYLFVIDRGAAVEGESSAKTLLDNDIIKQINASKEGNIVYLDPNYWYLSGGGLISVSEMVKEIETSLE
ncbi:siderophore ABC transporter substrate-binding protein [Sutcliffiella horikoshii]|uniref:Siderophore ABC transporter substrate-binding protein n=1 Tax=Sutcliffiella horikoshii TaxID=79883 RepID=A0AA94WQU5_9BACI|nr:siderophore ABC transporter substrate-binding protein [Sutcliffiella horikoshii]TYS61089.1 siderophore ABC transporter substrate-binding protein [Sutcliffiella horikoshii]